MLTPQSPPTNAYLRMLNYMGWSLVIFLCVFTELATLDELLAGLWFGTAGVAISGLVSSFLYMAPFILGGIMFYVFGKQIKTQPVRCSVRIPSVFPLLILAGMAVITAAAYVNSWFCELIGYSIPPELVAPVDYGDASTVIQYMTIGLAPAFAEEFLFRGVIYGNLRPYGKVQAVLVSSALFALMHQNIGQFFYTFVGGMAMALMYELTGSIWCSIFFHLLNNELSVLTEVLYYGKYGEAVAPFLNLFDLAILLLGMVSIGILILHYRKKSIEAKVEQEQGVFGKQGSTLPEAYDEPVTTASVLRGMRTPGMIVFIILSLVATTATYFVIRFGDVGDLL